MTRQFTPTPRPRRCYWGEIQSAEQIAPGIWSVSTPSHGGFVISPERKAAMPEPFRSAPTFTRDPLQYEEDCDWSIVVCAFPGDFPAEMVQDAHLSLANWHKALVPAREVAA